MPSERVQRRIDRLLDELEVAADGRDWPQVRLLADDILRLDPENEDAKTFLAAAVRDSVAETTQTESPRLEAQTLPASFAGGRYAVKSFLGEGGRKRVYLAHDTRLDRDVAVAVIKTEGLDEPGLARVRREAQAMARLGDHPHVVTIFDTLEEGSQTVIVSQYMEGGSLADLIERAEGHHLDAPTILRIGLEVCQGLEHAHARGIIHRDLKPSNIFLTKENSSCLGDFGLARVQDRSQLSAEGMMVGTFAYIPPEQAMGRPADARSDLYSLGCVLYEMLTGRPPFAGDDAVALISQHVNAPPVAPSWLTDQCPRDLETLVLRLLAKSPDDRPRSAAEVGEALARIDPTQKPISHSGPGANPLERLAQGVFVGRQQELDRLRNAFDEALAGRGSLVMLVGEPGIGKTRTTAELETQARMRGAQVLWGPNYEAEGAPAYWPWYRIGNAYPQEHLAQIQAQQPPDVIGELSRIFPQLRQLPNFVEPPPVTDAESAQFRLFDAYAAFVRAMADRTPLLVCLDDLHWTDKASLLLLRHLARELSHLRVLIVGTYRDTELSRTHPLSEALAELNRDPGFERIVLRGLTKEEVATYIKRTAAVEPKSVIIDRIYEETEGNAFFLSEVVKLMAQEGTLSKDSVSDIAVPDGVKEALGRRLNQISEETNEVLQVAAVVGREFTYDMLTLLGDRDEERLLRLIEEAMRARVIEETDRALRYRFTHAQMQETLLEELSTTRRVRLHGQVGEALEKRWGDLADDRASRLARHFVEAATLSRRHAQRAVHYSRLAAGQAEAQTAWDEAARHYESCLTLITASEEALGEDEAALLVALGRCLRYDAQLRAAWRSFMRATTIYRARGDGAGMARAALEASVIYAPRERLVALAQEALNALGESDLRLRGHLLFMRAGNAFDDASKAAAQEAERIARTLDDPALLGLLASRQAWEAFGEKRIDEAVSLSRRAHVVLDDGGERQRAANIGTYAAEWPLFEGKLDEGLAAVKEAQAYARKFHVRIYELNCLAYLQAAALIRCDFDRFESILNQVAGDNFWIPMIRAARAEMFGDIDAALKLTPTPDAPGGVAADALAQLLGSLARTRFNAGREDEARKYLEECNKELAEVTERQDFRISAIAALDECLPTLGSESQIRPLYEELAEWEIFRYSPSNARGLDHIRGALAMRLERIDEAEEWYQTGLEWAERERCPVEAGRCLQGLAEVAQRRGQRREALRSLDQATELFQRHGARLYLDQLIPLRMALQGIDPRSHESSIDAVSATVQRERPDLRPQAAPDGTVTIMFTDIEGSTPMAERLGDQDWLALLRVHNAIVRQQVRACDAFEVNTWGDAFMLAFDGAPCGLECAIGIQRAFAAYNEEHPEQPIRVRIGLHTGEAVKEADNFYGRHVVLASRIADKAAGGQILVSSALKELGQNEGTFSFDDGHEVELKGLSGKHRVFEVVWN